MKYTKIQAYGAILEMPGWLAHMWPYDLPLDKWPTFCGAGRGLGDWLVPDSIYDAQIAPACFVHDIDWIVSPDSYRGFQAANNRFFCNLWALCRAQLPYNKLPLALLGCLRYWSVVSTVGMKAFNPSYVLDTYPADNKEIRAKLHRLAMARLNTV